MLLAEKMTMKTSWAVEYIELKVGDITAEGDLRYNEGRRRRVTGKRSGIVLEPTHFDDGQSWLRPCPGQMTLPFRDLKAGDTVWVGLPGPRSPLKCQVASNDGGVVRVQIGEPQKGRTPSGFCTLTGYSLNENTLSQMFFKEEDCARFGRFLASYGP
jgi:hypothetical protein